MSLTKYKQKRNFQETSEPVGKEKGSAGKLIFVVQEHWATNLHYDFRLEMEGVLKSWAVPKGPSMNPQDRPLAVQVEDHPYDYKDFEGTIPKGNYGAGNVIVWDNGTYHSWHFRDKKNSEKELLEGLKKGHITFILEGKKLKGEFALIQMKGRGDKNWLLIKKGDQYASEKNILEKKRSVLTGKILKAREKSTKAEPKVKPAKAEPKKKEQLERIKPMLAELVEEPFDHENWVFEVKYDGYRALAGIDDNGVDLYSRNFLSFNERYGPIVQELKKIHHQALLDGEIVIEDEKGVSRFQLLQNYLSSGKGTLKYYVFDLLDLDGNNTRDLPLKDRKELLQMLLKKSKLKNIVYSEHIETNGKKFFELAEKRKLEGIIAKDLHSIYHPGKRSSDWKKIKITQEQEAVIAGISAPQGGRKHFGALILGAYNKNTFEYIGNAGTGFSDTALKDLYAKFEPYFTAESPFTEKITAKGKIQWMKPHFVCQVKFSEWTEDHHMRHPVYLGLREDKKSKEVIPEIPMKSSEEEKSGKKDKSLKVGNVNLILTNQEKIYWKDEGYTKGDLVQYYTEISSIMLPYLKDRPESMRRFPNGISGPNFFQKDVDRSKVPQWLHTEKVFSESNNDYIEYLICNDKATLIYMANLGCIEINPWNSRLEKPDNPDWIVIDLDPEAIAFSKVVKTANAVRKVLEELDINSYPKTSGSRGMHIYIPLGAKYTYDIGRTFAQLIAERVHRLVPDITSIVRSPSKRQKRVYLDYLQNSKGQTLAAPYSVRPKPGATVSTPLQWSEVNAKLDPSAFTMKTIFKRLDKKGDLWKPVIGKGAASIEKTLKKLSEGN